MLDLIAKGGIVLWLIIALSGVVVYIVIERLLYFRKIRVDEDKLFLRIRMALEKGHYDEALAICDSNVSPLSALIKVGIENRDLPAADQKETMKDSADQEIPRLEKHVSTLDTIAHISPLLGLLGTVTGTMKAFGVLGTFGAVSDPTILAKGISEALINTTAGIIVAVPAVIFYNYFVSRVNRTVVTLEGEVNRLYLMIHSNGASAGDGTV